MTANLNSLYNLGSINSSTNGVLTMKQTPKKRVTLQDVARRAGVSTAVVSYAINNGPRPISDEARARVVQAIAELGYQPNAFAQAMAMGSQRARTIGFIIQDISPRGIFTTPYVAGLLSGVAAHLKDQRYYLLVYQLAIDEPLSNIEELVGSRRIDGVIIRLVQDPPQTDALLETIAKAHLPCVCIERQGAPRFGFGSITYGDQQAAHAATRLLIEQGHQRIAHIQGDLRAAAAHDRREGYRQALTEAGIAVDERLITGNSWSLAEGGAAMQRILANGYLPTAIFAANDYLAMGAISVLRRRGLRIPEDIAVIGYDDIPEAAEADPPLTTVRVPLMEIGERAATRVLHALSGQISQTGIEEVVPAQLIRRSSV